MGEVVEWCLADFLTTTTCGCCGSHSRRDRPPPSSKCPRSGARVRDLVDEGVVQWYFGMLSKGVVCWSLVMGAPPPPMSVPLKPLLLGLPPP